MRKILYGVSTKYDFGWHHTVTGPFPTEEEARKWLSREEHDFREREIMGKTAAIRLAGRAAVENAVPWNAGVEKIDRAIENKMMETGAMGTETVTVTLTLTEEEKEDFLGCGKYDTANYWWDFEGNGLTISYTEEPA